MNPQLVEFLARAGAEIIEPKSEWELARFRAKGEVAVIYRNYRERVSFSGDVARQAYNAWRTGAAFLATEKVKRVKRPPQIAALLTRDGCACFFCDIDMQEDEMTLEHLVPICHGGNNHLSNLALAHEACNMRAGNLSVVEKILLREKMRRGGDA